MNTLECYGIGYVTEQPRLPLRRWFSEYKVRNPVVSPDALL